MPGYEKTCSVTSEPETTKPSDRAKPATEGRIAFRAAYRCRTRTGERPFASAVVM